MRIEDRDIVVSIDAGKRRFDGVTVHYSVDQDKLPGGRLGLKDGSGYVVSGLSEGNLYALVGAGILATLTDPEGRTIQAIFTHSRGTITYSGPWSEPEG